MRSVLVFLLLLPLFSTSQNQSTPLELVGQIKQNISCSWANKTVDTFKSGNPNAPISGVAVCMFADMPTLQKAVDMNCNFIITHEPVFYNHSDETKNYVNDPVYLEKKKFIEDHKLIIFRFHDHIHRTTPDGIYEGMVNKLGWKEYVTNEQQTHFEFPEQTLAAFAVELKTKLGLPTIRLIGNPEMKFKKVGLAVGAPGGQTHIKMLSKPNVEVMVAGEAPEWETYLYTNDAVSQGKNKAVLFLGHIKSEEAGMEYCATWLKGFVKDIPIHFIENKLNFIEL